MRLLFPSTRDETQLNVIFCDAFCFSRWEQTTIAADWMHIGVDTPINSSSDDGCLPGIGPVGWDIVAPMGVKSSPPRKRHRNIFAGNAKDRLYALRLLIESSDARFV